ncbi:protein-arginine kinase activator protein [Weizmannia acidilactici]|nr:protein-arginine kinase activator protein [Weizmannia acidilactici]GER73289.1 protein-arginine kinase activator protein [Weizmannia acidilactici]
MHFTKIVNGTKTEIHLCEKCAQEKGEMFSFDWGKSFSFDNLLSGLFNFDPAIQIFKQEAAPNPDVLRCNHCGMTFNQFLNTSRFGCPHCYEAFQHQLVPILRRLHGGNIAHEGKIPARIGGAIYTKKKLAQLKEALQAAVEREEFEKAAELRDQIRALESSSLGKGGEQ